MSIEFDLNPYIQKLSVSPTLRINQKLKDLRAQGKEVSHFGFGQSPFTAPELLEQALKENAGRNTYLPTQGLPELREAISEWMASVFNITTSAQGIFIGPGSKECIFDLLYLLQGTVLIPQGSWVSYKPISTLLNKPIEIIPTTFESRYCLEPEALDQVCERIDGPKILILNNPNNPTGQIFDEATLKALAKICEKRQVIVISDEIYGLVQFTDTSYTSIQHYYPDGTIVTSGLSKAFSAGGYRLGFAALPDSFSKLFPYYNSLISETYSGVASPVQYAALSLFSEYEKVKPYIACCNQIHRWLLRHTHQKLVDIGFRSLKPQGAFYLVADLESYRQPLEGFGITTGQALCDHLLSEYGVALLPGSDFGFEPSFLGFRIAPVDYVGQKVMQVFSTENATNEFGNWFPSVKRGLDQLENFVHSLSQ